MENMAWKLLFSEMYFENLIFWRTKRAFEEE